MFLQSFAALTSDAYGDILFDTEVTGVQEGDFVSIFIESSAGISDLFSVQTGVQDVATRTFDVTEPVDGHDWTTGGTTTTAFCPFIVLVEAPNIVFIGDSRTEGQNEHFSYINPQGGTDDTDDPTRTIPHKVAELFASNNLTYRNMGVSGHGTAAIISRLQRDVIDLKPKLVVIATGADIILSVPQVTFLANMTSILDDCKTAGIRIILSKIPGADAGTVNDANSAIRRAWNVLLEDYAVSHNAIVIDVDGSLGKIRESTGELDDIKDDLAGVDNTHFSIAGNDVVAALYEQAINSQDGAVVKSLQVPALTQDQIDNTTVPTDSYRLVANKDTNDLTLFNRTGSQIVGSGSGSTTAVKWKDPVRVATTANGTLATAYANGQTVDGVVLATADRILLKNQTTGAENGIYTVNASGAPTRATDFDGNDEVSGAVTIALEGTANAGKSWRMTNIGAIVVGTTGLTFEEFGRQPGWETLVSQTLTTAATTIESGTFTAKKFLRIRVILLNEGPGDINTGLRFNNDNGTSSYHQQTSQNYGTLSAFNNLTSVSLDIGGAQDGDVFAVVDIVNLANSPKHYVANGTADDGADGAPNVQQNIGYWRNTSEQITDVEVTNVGTADFDVGSTLIIEGSDFL